MAYRSFRGGSGRLDTRLDTPPSINRRHPNSCLAPAALDHLRAHDVEITFEEDRQGGVVNGPRAYFHDPDGTVLEFIDLTSYACSPS